MSSTETWENLVQGRVYYKVTVDKTRGTTQDRYVEGKGKQLKIQSEDREEMQMSIVHAHVDPFTNGMLKRIDADQNDDPRTASPNAVDDTELSKILAYKQTARFKKALEDLNEISFRRLRDMAKDDGDSVTVAQQKALGEVYEAKWSPNLGLTGPRSSDEVVASFPEMDLTGKFRTKE